MTYKPKATPSSLVAHARKLARMAGVAAAEGKRDEARFLLNEAVHTYKLAQAV